VFIQHVEINAADDRKILGHLVLSPSGVVIAIDSDVTLRKELGRQGVHYVVQRVVRGNVAREGAWTTEKVDLVYGPALAFALPERLFSALSQDRACMIQQALAGIPEKVFHTRAARRTAPSSLSLRRMDGDQFFKKNVLFQLLMTKL
jgi:hypothetical protein